MKIFLKLLSFILVLTTLITAIGISPAFTAPQIKKGTTRVVIGTGEVSKCEDVVVYNNKRYLSATLYANLFFSSESDIYESVYKASNNSITLNARPSGYMTFWAGSKNVTFKGNTNAILINPPVFYDKHAYISLDDIALALSVRFNVKLHSGFDVQRNTVYFYM